MVFNVRPEKEIKIYRERDGEQIFWDRLNTYDDFIVFADNLKKAKRQFVSEKGLKSSRNLHFHEIQFSTGIQTIYSTGDNMVYVFYEGKKVFEWNNNANSDYPEDLTWDRMLSDIFYEGIKVGKDIANGKFDE